MHQRAKDYVKGFVQELAERNLDANVILRVVEFGSYDVNGSVRDLFHGLPYTGVDVRSGKGVDVVGDAAEWGEDGCCEVVVSTEVLEHAENAAALVANAFRLLVAGGVFIVTAAGPGRNPHGNDGGAVGDEFYRNIEPGELAEWLDEAGFSDYEIDVTPDGQDIRVTARKAVAKGATKK